MPTGLKGGKVFLGLGTLVIWETGAWVPTHRFLPAIKEADSPASSFIITLRRNDLPGILSFLGTILIE